MRSAQVTLGRQFVLVFDHGDDFFDALNEFCIENSIRQGFLPGFITGFREVDLVGTCDKIENPDAPVWSKVHLENAEACGGGNLVWDETTGKVAPHLHASARLKAHGAGNRSVNGLGVYDE